MLIFRALVGFLFVAALLCFAFYLGTGQPGYKRWAMLTRRFSNDRCAEKKVVGGRCL